MIEAQDGAAPEKPLRTWRPMLWWTLGILAALALAWFVGAVAVPVWQTRAVVAELYAAHPRPPGFPGVAYSERSDRQKMAVEKLGGPERSAQRLKAYLALPGWLAGKPSYGHRSEAAQVLEFCGQPGVRVLAKSLRDGDRDVRLVAAWALAGMESDIRPAVPALEGALQDGDTNVRAAAAEALKKIRGEEPPKKPAPAATPIPK